MAESTQLIGGNLTYGTTADSSWQVRLGMTVEAASDPERAPQDRA